MFNTAAPALFTTSFSTPTESPRYNLSIGYLRAFVIILVLAHHAVLAYYPDVPQPLPSLLAAPRLWPAFPVVDPHRWSGFRLFVSFNDLFFMSLLFFLSGLFVWSSLEIKGTGRFLRDRALRLGLPFLVAAGILAPLAYYPAYLQTAGPHSFGSYAHQWLSLGYWPAGPAWFIWVLLVFDGVAAMLFVMASKAGVFLARLPSNSARRPISFFAILLTTSAIAYIPMALAFHPLSWTSFGPFTFQTSRILHYAIYFLGGISVGAFGLDHGLLAPAGKLASRWWLWTIAALAAFLFALVIAVLAFTNYSHAPYAWGFGAACGFVLSCATSCFALLAVFVRFCFKRKRIFDSLRSNAYGMYLIHYIFVTWVQYSLLRVVWPGFVKGTLVFLVALILSMVATLALRRLPMVKTLI